jgi:hypothetical protein
MIPIKSKYDLNSHDKEQQKAGSIETTGFFNFESQTI